MTMTDTQIKNLVKSYLAGVSIVDLVSNFRISSTAIYQILRKEGIEPTRVRTWKDRLANIRKDHIKGLSREEILKKYNAPIRVYYRAIK